MVYLASILLQLGIESTAVEAWPEARKKKTAGDVIKWTKNCSRFPGNGSSIQQSGLRPEQNESLGDSAFFCRELIITLIFSYRQQWPGGPIETSARTGPWGPGLINWCIANPGIFPAITSPSHHHSGGSGCSTEVEHSPH